MEKGVEEWKSVLGHGADPPENESGKPSPGSLSPPLNKIPGNLTLEA